MIGVLAVSGSAANTATLADGHCTGEVSGETHQPISIMGDLGLMVPNVATIGSGVRSGTGTANDPFVIDNWEIVQDSDAGGGAPAINIRDTTLHVVIREVVVHASASQLWPAISLVNVRNVVMERITILGDAPMGAIDLLEAKGIVLDSIRLSGSPFSASPGLGITLGAAEVTILDLISCGNGDILVRRPGNTGTFRSVVEINGMQAAGDQPVTVAIPNARSVTAKNLRGPIHLAANIVDEGQLLLDESQVRLVNVYGHGSKHAVTRISNTTIDSGGSCDFAGGLWVDTKGPIALESTTIRGYPQWLAVLTGSALGIKQSVFDERGANGACGSSVDPLISLVADCTETCGPFIFADNDVFETKGRTALAFGVIRGSGDEKLIGSGNYLGDASVRGDVTFTEKRSTPQNTSGPAEEAAGPGWGMNLFFVALATVVVAFSARPLRRCPT